MQQKKKTQKSVQVLKGVGYFFALGGWLWILLFYTPFILESSLFADRQVITPEVAVPQQPASPLTPIAVVASLVLAVGVVSATVYSLAKLPLQVFKTGEKLAEISAGALVPVFAPPKAQPAQKKRLRIQLTLGVQLMLALLPAVLALPFSVLSFPEAFAVGITFYMIMLLVGFHACAATTAFLGAFLVAQRS